MNRIKKFKIAATRKSYMEINAMTAFDAVRDYCQKNNLQEAFYVRTIDHETKEFYALNSGKIFCVEL